VSHFDSRHKFHRNTGDAKDQGRQAQKRVVDWDQKRVTYFSHPPLQRRLQIALVGSVASAERGEQRGLAISARTCAKLFSVHAMRGALSIAYLLILYVNL